MTFDMQKARETCDGLYDAPGHDEGGNPCMGREEMSECDRCHVTVPTTHDYIVVGKTAKFGQIASLCQACIDEMDEKK
jgi:hypothetical protein